MPLPSETPTRHDDPFPRQQARTRRFALGAPRSFTVSPDGARVVFLRSSSGTDPVNALHVLDTASGDERVVADPRAMSFVGDDDLPAAERARRERMRETTSGITGYSSDTAATTAAFALSGRLHVVDLVGDDGARELDVPGPVVDPRLSPDGRHVAYVASGTVHVVDVDGSGHRVLLAPESATVTYGLADFIAAEELDRSRGLWWSPSSDALVVERSDEADVPLWYIADPASPQTPPVEHRYPAAGRTNPAVSLHLVPIDGGPSTPIEWDHDGFEYLVSFSWQRRHDPLVTVLSRDQRTMLTLRVDTATGESTTVLEATDPCWVEVVPGLPAWAPDGRLAHVVDDSGARRIALDGAPLTPASLQITAVLDVAAHGLLVTGTDEPTAQRLLHVGWDGALADLSPADGRHSGVVGGDVLVRSSSALGRTGALVVVERPGQAPHRVASHAEVPAVTPEVRLLTTGPHEVRTAVLLPSGHVPGSRRLPVLLSPYGGPHAQRVVQAGQAFLESQWFADQGFAVVVADGRGTPARGPDWERAVSGDLATAPLQDQVDALAGVAEAFPDDVDTTRVGIRGWSFGGFLAALAVLRRPDVFHVAIAGAPVTDWRLYDTAYSERYLGHPDVSPEAYEASSLLPDAASLSRPLMLVHGLADDNVVVAHTLALSGALLAAGRPHTVLPLTGVTHMTPQEHVAENLLRLQVDFLQRHLGGA